MLLLLLTLPQSLIYTLMADLGQSMCLDRVPRWFLTGPILLLSLHSNLKVIVEEASTFSREVCEKQRIPLPPKAVGFCCTSNTSPLPPLASSEPGVNLIGSAQDYLFPGSDRLLCWSDVDGGRDLGGNCLLRFMKHLLIHRYHRH